MDGNLIIGVVTTVVTVVGAFASLWKILTDKITAVHDRCNALQDRVAVLEGDAKLFANELEHLKGNLAQALERIEKKMDQFEKALDGHMREEPSQLRGLLRDELRRLKDD